MKRILAAVLAIVCLASLAACNMSGAIVYDIGNNDRANYFCKTYNEFLDKYGEAELKDDATYGKVLSGVAVVRLMDVTGDGVYELYIAYADGTKPYVNKQYIVGFEYGSAILLDEEITSKASASDSTPSVWLYKDSTGRSYVVFGEDMSKSADYYTFIQKKNGEDYYKFDKEFTELNGSEPAGDTEKISVAGIDEDTADRIFKENSRVVDSINGQATKK
ncbi:MAG: hypothetical protein ACI4GZ_01820 [Ruminococcus sp.]